MSSVAQRKRNNSVWYRSRTASDYDTLSHLSFDAEDAPSVFDAGSAHGNREQHRSSAQECHDEERNRHGSRRGVAHPRLVYHISTGA